MSLECPGREPGQEFLSTCGASLTFFSGGLEFSFRIYSAEGGALGREEEGGSLSREAFKGEGEEFTDMVSKEDPLFADGFEDDGLFLRAGQVKNNGAVREHLGDLGELIEGAEGILRGPEGFGLIADAEELAYKGVEEPRGEGEVLARGGSFVFEGFAEQAVQGAASQEVAIESGLHEGGGDAGGIDEGGGLREAQGVAAQQGTLPGRAGEQAECAGIFHGEVPNELLVQGGHGSDGGGFREDIIRVSQVVKEGGEEGEFIAKAFKLGVEGLLEEGFDVGPDAEALGEEGVGLLDEGMDEGRHLAMEVGVLEFVFLLLAGQTPLLLGDAAEAMGRGLEEALYAEAKFGGGFCGRFLKEVALGRGGAGRRQGGQGRWRESVRGWGKRRLYFFFPFFAERRLCSGGRKVAGKRFLFRGEWALGHIQAFRICF